MDLQPDLHTLVGEEPTRIWKHLSPRKKRKLERPGFAQATAKCLISPEEMMSLPAGPSNGREAVHWASTDLDALSVRGIAKVGVDLKHRLVAALKRGVIMRTDYSGVGGAEESLRQMLLAMHDQDPDFWPKNIKVQRSGDVLPGARKILATHHQPCRPRCIHGDLLDRLPPPLLKRLERLHRRHNILAQGRLNDKKKKATKKKSCRAKAESSCVKHSRCLPRQMQLEIRESWLPFATSIKILLVMGVL